jgi:hypothetical protein
MQLAAVDVLHAVHLPGQMHHALTAKDLSGSRLAAQSRREVQGATPVPVPHGHRLAGIQADPHRQRTIGMSPRLVQEAQLEIDGREHRLT